MNRRTLAIFIFLGAAGTLTALAGGCELLVTFPASEITEGGVDGFTPLDAPGNDTRTDTTPPSDAGKDIATDSPKDVATDTPVDAPPDVESDVHPDVEHDAPADVMHDAVPDAMPDVGDAQPDHDAG